ncbi:sulfatase-like hydrolase/transferase [Peptococcus simiae]|uniref:Sulfatase-like hydrolase/transferase n=1 Tax=Peptococcus simiae TaxID=1643805 RepID=A0ABW9H337_9FIRM
MKEKLKALAVRLRGRIFTRDVAKFLSSGALAAAVLTLVVLFIGSWGYATGLFTSYFTNPLTLLLNFLPIYACILLIGLIVQSLRVSVFLSGLFWLGIAVGNMAMINWRHAALKPDDLALAIPMLKILPHYLSELDISLAFYALAGILALGLFARLMPKTHFHPLSRLLAALLIVAIGAGTGTAVYASTPLYKSQYLKNQKQWCDSTGITYRLHSDRYQANGVVYSMSYNTKFALGNDEAGYNPTNGQALAEKYGSEPIPKDQKVHIITILLESYMDFSDTAKPSTLQFPDGNPYDPLHALQDRCISGEMISDVYGGGTINIETGVLTGLYKRHNYINRPGPSNVRYFLENGYTTVAMHPNDGYFYSRFDRNPNLGFQNFLYTQNHFKNNLSEYMPDSVLMPDIKAQLDRYKAQGPTFLYAATMQGHGPYNCVSIKDKEWFPYQEGMRRPAYVMLNNYFTDVNQTATALTDLINSLENDDEPVIVLAFGDHSPRMEEGGYDILGLKAPDGTVQAKLNNYATPYLIYGNNKAKAMFNTSFTGQGPTIDPEQLISNVLFKELGWHGNAYQAFMQDMGNRVTCQKRDFWVVDGQPSVIYPQEIKSILDNVVDIDIFHKRQKYEPADQIDERANVDKYESNSPAGADPDSSENAATRAQTGQSKGR